MPAFNSTSALLALSTLAVLAAAVGSFRPGRGPVLALAALAPVSHWSVLLLGAPDGLALPVASLSAAPSWVAPTALPGWTLLLQLDGLGSSMLALTVLLTATAVAIPAAPVRWPSLYRSLLVLPLPVLLVFFAASDLFAFYAAFEGALIPLFLVIGAWGSRPRRIWAAYQFFLYTLVASLIMLAALSVLHGRLGSLHWSALSTASEALPAAAAVALFLALLLPLAVKVPLPPFHSWLPEAHVEAPTTGSVLLAGVLLKLGVFGISRWLSLCSVPSLGYTSPLLSALATVGVVGTALAALREVDAKRIVAYSSISHMSLVALSAWLPSSYGSVGTVLVMVSHGLCSGALFLMVGALYDRHGSRLLRYYGGLSTVVPRWSSALLALLLVNCGLPGSSAFSGELLLFAGATSRQAGVGGVALLGTVVLSAALSLWAAGRLIHGSSSAHIGAYNDLTRRESLALVPVGALIAVLGLGAASVGDAVAL